MSVLKRREKIGEDVVKDRFVRQQLQEESKDIEKAQSSLMARRGFSSSFWDDRSYNIEGNNTMVYSHLVRHRFVDMKYLKTKNGRHKKKNHPIHNRILYGHANNIIKRLHFGFTQAVQAKLAKEI